MKFLSFFLCLTIFIVVAAALSRQKRQQSTPGNVIISRSQLGPFPVGSASVQIVTSFGGGGQGQFVGVPIPGSLVRELDDGTKVKDCWDPNTGVHQHGTIWNSAGVWKLECKNGTMDAVACITNTGTEIPVDSTTTIDGFWHKCQVNGSEVKYSQEPSCYVNGKRLHIGDTFAFGGYMRKCEEYGASIVGCLYLDENKTEQTLAIGETREIGRFKHSCQADPNIEGRVRYDQTRMWCEHNGKVYQKGEKWTSQNLQYYCDDQAIYRITNCITDNGTVIPIGETLINNNMLYKCYRLFNSVHYRVMNCNFGMASSLCNSPASFQSPGGQTFVHRDQATFISPGGQSTTRIFRKSQPVPLISSQILESLLPPNMFGVNNIRLFSSDRNVRVFRKNN